MKNATQRIFIIICVGWIDEYFSNIISLYDFNMAKEITNSEIENEKFLIKYEEFEG